MNGTKRREALSSGCAVKCMLDAYSNEGHALAIRMSPKLGFSEWFASSDLDAILKGDYELPGDRTNALLTRAQKNWETLLKTVLYLTYESTVWNSRRDSNSKKLKELRICMRHSNEVQHLRKAASRSADQLQQSRKIVQENGWEVVYNLGKKDQHSAKSHAAADNKKPQDLEGLLNKMSPSAETRRSNYPQLKAAMLERKLDLASALSDSDHLHERYETEYASNGQSRRLLKIAGEMKEAYVEIEKAHMAIFEAEEKMEAAEQNLLQ
ncbi:uncharacterized protein FOBCDRAFT_208837 [Fusarium oxysporum Fo47]|uniref:uncharacterized protein n=1 Tax=Fusarium oxysporum Fo47 TaxID=660027 RepID=UPI002869A663|nr:uncharacterized protein FOBCDRAFT_208837 [Fusarium oxysporum Fo47]QKD62171.2 hypothetical protein FOBCDRAFT_208837 [Fusarium oxysporum Fo47]